MEAPEVPLESAQEHINEHAHAHGHAGGGGRPSWILGVALSSALVAALAAVASLQAGHHANEAMLAQIDANNQILKASDQWSYYQAKGVKLAILQNKIEMLKVLQKGGPATSEHPAAATAPPPAAAPESAPAGSAAEATEPAKDSTKAAKKKETDEDKVKRYEKEQDDITEKAHELEHKADELKEDGEKHLEHHVGLAKSVTMFQICIAVAAISVLTNRRIFWFVSLAFAAYGIFAMIMGILH